MIKDHAYRLDIIFRPDQNIHNSSCGLCLFQKRKATRNFINVGIFTKKYLPIGMKFSHTFLKKPKVNDSEKIVSFFQK